MSGDTGVREELAAALCRLWGYEPDDPDVAVAAAEVLDVVMPTVQRLIDQGKAEVATDALMWAALTVEHSPGIKHQAKAVREIRARAAALDPTEGRR